MECADAIRETLKKLILFRAVDLYRDYPKHLRWSSEIENESDDTKKERKKKLSIIKLLQITYIVINLFIPHELPHFLSRFQVTRRF